MPSKKLTDQSKSMKSNDISGGILPDKIMPYCIASEVLESSITKPNWPVSSDLFTGNICYWEERFELITETRHRYIHVLSVGKETILKAAGRCKSSAVACWRVHQTSPTVVSLKGRLPQKFQSKSTLSSEIFQIYSMFRHGLIKKSKSRFI